MQEQKTPIHRILDEKKRKEIIGLLTLGCSRRKAAHYVGCAPSTITRAVCRDPEFAAQVARAEQNIETLALANIRAACKQERYWRASAWVLEHCNPEDFATRPLDVMTKEQVDQLLTQFTEVILRELPPDLWHRVTTAFDEFIQATQQEIRDSQPRESQTQESSPDSSTQQASTKAGTPVDTATSSTPTPTAVEPTTSAESLHSLESGLAAIERMIALVGGPAASPATQHPSNDRCELTATAQSTTPEPTITSDTQQKPKNVTPSKGVAQTVLHSPESETVPIFMSVKMGLSPDPATAQKSIHCRRE